MVTRQTSARSRRGLLLGLVAASLMALASPAAQASRSRMAPVSKLSFEAFLEAGPAYWSHATPRLPHHRALPLDPNGNPVTSLFLDYLLYRRGLNPARFDVHHPNLAPILAGSTFPTTGITAAPAITPLPQIVTPSPPLIPPAVQKVPEPSTILMAAVLLAGGWRLARARRGQPPFSETVAGT